MVAMTSVLLRARQLGIDRQRQHLVRGALRLEARAFLPSRGTRSTVCGMEATGSRSRYRCAFASSEALPGGQARIVYWLKIDSLAGSTIGVTTPSMPRSVSS